MGLPEGVTVDDLQYGYIPATWVCVIFVVLFSISTATHVGQTICFRTWYMIPTVILAGIGEIIGWAARLWSSRTYLGNAEDPYLMQICATIIAPTPLLAANFVTLGLIIGYLGSQYSRLSPKWYTAVFCTAEISALVVQAAGGAMAAGADDGDRDASKMGGNIMLGGIVLQLVAIILYSTLGTEFIVRYFKDRPVRKLVEPIRRPIDQKLQIMLGALVFSTLCLFIRAIYRTLELAEGWGGRILRTEIYFNVLDGAMIVLAIYTINFFHPGFLLANTVYAVKKTVKSSAQSSLDDVTLAQGGYDASALEMGKVKNYARVGTREVDR